MAEDLPSCGWDSERSDRGGMGQERYPGLSESSPNHRTPHRRAGPGSRRPPRRSQEDESRHWCTADTPTAPAPSAGDGSRTGVSACTRCHRQSMRRRQRCTHCWCSQDRFPLLPRATRCVSCVPSSSKSSVKLFSSHAFRSLSICSESVWFDLKLNRVFWRMFHQRVARLKLEIARNVADSDQHGSAISMCLPVAKNVTESSARLRLGTWVSRTISAG